MTMLSYTQTDTNTVFRNARLFSAHLSAMTSQQGDRELCAQLPVGRMFLGESLALWRLFCVGIVLVRHFRMRTDSGTCSSTSSSSPSSSSLDTPSSASIPLLAAAAALVNFHAFSQK